MKLKKDQNHIPSSVHGGGLKLFKSLVVIWLVSHWTLSSLTIWSRFGHCPRVALPERVFLIESFPYYADSIICIGIFVLKNVQPCTRRSTDEQKTKYNFSSSWQKSLKMTKFLTFGSSSRSALIDLSIPFTWESFIFLGFFLDFPIFDLIKRLVENFYRKFLSKNSDIFHWISPNIGRFSCNNWFSTLNNDVEWAFWTCEIRFKAVSLVETVSMMNIVYSVRLGLLDYLGPI